jgi:CspA family cold shock protein
MKGTIKFFNTMKGFGFIAAEDGKEYFVHQSALPPGVTPKERDEVTFDVVQGEKGPKAANAKIGAAPAAKHAPMDVANDNDADDSTDEDAEDEEQAA